MKVVMAGHELIVLWGNEVVIVVCAGDGRRRCRRQSKAESKVSVSNKAKLSTAQSAQDRTEHSGATEGNTRAEWPHVCQAVVTCCVCILLHLVSCQNLFNSWCFETLTL